MTVDNIRLLRDMRISECCKVSISDRSSISESNNKRILIPVLAVKSSKVCNYYFFSKHTTMKQLQDCTLPYYFGKILRQSSLKTCIIIMEVHYFSITEQPIMNYSLHTIAKQQDVVVTAFETLLCETFVNHLFLSISNHQTDLSKEALSHPSCFEMF